MNILEIILSITLSGIFFVSSIPKLRNPRRFVLVTLEYRILPPGLGHAAGWLIPPLELLIALLLISGTASGCTAIASFILLMSFIVAISVNIWRGRTMECNCFGDTQKRKIGWKLLLQDLLLAFMALCLARIAHNWIGLESWSLFYTLQHTAFGSIPVLLLCILLTTSMTILLKKYPSREKQHGARTQSFVQSLRRMKLPHQKGVMQ